MWRRFVAVGDSFTEGIGDPRGDGRDRGWADRFAEQLALAQPDLLYANLAVRGARLTTIVSGQVPVALSLRPDLVSISGGVNDALRPRWHLPAVADALESGVAAVRGGGADVLIVTFGQPARRSRTLGLVQERLRDYREAILDIADRHGCLVADFWHAGVFDDERLWSGDRLHLNAMGHERVAHAVMESVGMAAPDWRRPLPVAGSVSRAERLRGDTAWVARHLAPWIGRRIRGRSSGDGIEPKRPQPSPVSGPAAG